MPESILRKLVSFAAFLCFGSMAFFLWHAQSRHEHELVLRHTETASEQLRIRLEGLITARIAALELLADRWIERKPADFSRLRFLTFARALVDHYPGIMSISWIDPGGVIQWVFPSTSEVLVKGKSVYEHPDPRYRSTFEEVEQKQAKTLSPCMEIFDGGTGFEAFLPLVHEGHLQGYLRGVFLVEQIMELSLVKDLYKDFRIMLYEDEQSIYQYGLDKPPQTSRDAARVMKEIEFHGKTWKLELSPNPEFQAALSAGNRLVLFFGLGLSAALALLLNSLLERMRMYKESRDQALHEVSERKRAEEALRRNERKLEALLDELKAKNAELESFVYTVSHDLKTPLVTIEGYIGAFKEDFADSISEVGEKYLKYMSDATRKMDILINDLLNLSRIGRLTEKKTEFPFSRLVTDALESLQPQIEARGISIQVQEELPLVYGEKKRLQQVMDNLLSNAVKYIGGANPAPRIEVGAAEENGRQVFFVRDNGIGIEEKYFDKIFQIFERLPAAKETGGGTGIGLTIVKRVVENHGGRIWLTSKLGEGTTFFFFLNPTVSHDP